MVAKRLEEIRARHHRDEKALAMSGDRPVQWHGTQPHADRGELLAALDEAQAQLRADIMEQLRRHREALLAAADDIEAEVAAARRGPGPMLLPMPPGGHMMAVAMLKERAQAIADVVEMLEDDNGT